MDGILIRERYKVVQVLWRAENYAAVEAVDIQERENPTLLMNLYGGELLHRYGEIYAGMKDCPAYRGMFLEDGALAAVFQPPRQGVPIDWLFFRGDKWSWSDRLNAAGAMMHLALSLAALPPEVSCAALCSDNLLLHPDEGAACARFLIRPMGEMTPRELTLLAGDQLKKLLPRRWDSCDQQIEMLERLELGDFPSIVPMYAWWRREEEEIRSDAEALAHKNFVSRFFLLLWKNMKRACRAVRRGT